MSNMSKRDQIKTWALIVQEDPAPGSWNMAADEFLFRSLVDKPETTLRFYRWKRATVSLGYSQRAAEAADLEFCRTNGIDVVRRMTGGKLVLHHNEVTYSLCSSDTELFTPTLRDSYRHISEGLVRGLEKMGLTACLADAPPSSYAKGTLPCFSYPAQDEIEIQGRKIIGSAQKRTGTRFLQHGSIPLEEDDELLKSVSLLREGEGLIRMISLSQALGRPVEYDWAVTHLASGMAEYFGAALSPREFTGEEKREIARIQKDRYDSPAWTLGE